ncbi:MAG TPA: ABC transporter ATP-binding protein [Thermoleophilia bacterium]|nr:ABC transporter ATP-binding protein [Thermoleophilia bacterium]HQG03099.1 ABC transporter ATP-binding protein [Thermoleophilia bacterium]HQG54399.1 ABC transporter ATP-binding protein [Thermoleophilia bacterium]HQJ97340.1 ABC transporter ATP-binding protein [Thermoleophilia bacterium]
MAAAGSTSRDGGSAVAELRGWDAFLHLARELRLARLARFAAPYWQRALLSVVAMVVVVLSGLAVPYLLKIAIDEGIQAGDLHTLDLVVIGFVVVASLNLGASYVQTYLTSWVGEHVVLDLRRALFAHIQKLSMDFFSRQKTGWIVSRLTNDIDALSELVTEGVTSLVTNGLTLAGAIVFLFVLDWRLALATLSIMPVVVAATLVFRARSARAYALVRDRLAAVSAHLQESISGVRVLKAFRREAADRAAFARVNAEYRDVNMRTVVQSGVYFPFVEFMSAVGTVIVLWYGGSLVSGGQLRIGVLVAFIAYLSSFFDPLQQLSQLYNTFQASMAAVQKIFTVLDTEPDMLDAPDAVPLPPVAGDLELRHVTFGYSEDEPVLRDVSFAVPAGRTIALVGATGAGKSTLVKLLARFYDPEEGAVLIDGHDLRTVTGRSLRKQLAVVPQEPFLFSGSLLDNIRFARPSARRDEVERVARVVGAHEFISALPDGYDTEVQEGGGGLSTGQRQLVSFARALLADPKVLILDEATSSVDAESERHIEAAMEALFRDRTAVIVAHRLSTVRHADEILVVDAGRIVERGSHDELLAHGGRYAELYREWQATGRTL